MAATTADQGGDRIFRPQATARAKAINALRRLCRPLTTAGIATVKAEYDGYGDSGGIEAVRFYDRRDQELPAPATIPTEQLDANLGELLPDGFAIGEGGYGMLILDPAAARVEVEHYIRTTEPDLRVIELARRKAKNKENG